MALIKGYAILQDTIIAAVAGVVGSIAVSYAVTFAPGFEEDAV